MFKLLALEKALRALFGVPVTRPRRGARTAESGPAPTVRAVQADKAGRQKFTVAFDGAVRAQLSRTLKELLMLLAADDGPSPDAIVAWKSLDKLGKLLQDLLGRNFDRQRVTQLVWRLRNALGPEAGLVETRTGLGVRLRIVRAGAVHKS